MQLPLITPYTNTVFNTVNTYWTEVRGLDILALSDAGADDSDKPVYLTSAWDVGYQRKTMAAQLVQGEERWVTWIGKAEYWAIMDARKAEKETQA